MKQGSPSEKQRIAGSEPRHSRQKESVLGGKKVWKCIRDMQICSLEEEVEFSLEWLPSVMRVENLAAHQLNSTHAGEDISPRC